MGHDLRDTSDWALVVEVGRWNHDALAEIYRRHAGPVFGLSNRLLVGSVRFLPRGLVTGIMKRIQKTREVKGGT